MNKFHTILFFLLTTSTLLAQNVNPDQDEIYRPREVAKIWLTMSKTDSSTLFHPDNVYSDEYLRAEFQFKNSVIDEVLAEDVGIRFRGNTSRTQPKKSFKLKFKEFGGEKFYDHKKFNLKAENNDPSIVREHLSMEAFRDANIPAARTHHVELFLNGEYIGIYLNVEQLDDEFVASRFDDDSGNLYKCSYGATMEDNGQYTDNGLYEIEINEDINDRSILDNFIDVLNNTSSSNFRTEIEKVFNVDSYLRYLALEALLGHWDGYSYNQNNFYLYENPVTGLVEFIPYDTDNTFGIDWVSRDWATRDVLDWPRHGSERPLTKKILAQDEYFERYRRIMYGMLQEKFNSDYYNPVFEQYQELLSASVEADPTFSLTFGFSHNDFENSIDQQVAGHVPYGLKPYIAARTSSALSQIGQITATSPYQNSLFRIYPVPSDGQFIMIESLGEVNKITLFDMSGRSHDYDLISNNGQTYKLSFDLVEGAYLVKINERVERILVK